MSEEHVHKRIDNYNLFMNSVSRLRGLKRTVDCPHDAFVLGADGRSACQNCRIDKSYLELNRNSFKLWFNQYKVLCAEYLAKIPDYEDSK